MKRKYESGQGIIEIILFIILVIVVILLIFNYAIIPIINWARDLISSSETPPVVEVLDIQHSILSETLTYKTWPPFQVDNCAGAMTYSEAQNYEESFVYQLVLDPYSADNVIKDEIYSQIKSAVSAKRGIAVDALGEQSFTAEISLEPGTKREYILIWSEVWERGTAKLLINKKEAYIQYRVRIGLSHSLRQSNLDCP